MSGNGDYGRRRDMPWIMAIIVTVLVVGFLGWLVLRSPDDSNQSARTAPTTTEAAITDPATVPVTIAGQATDPPVSDPATVDPGTTDPASSDPATVDSVADATATTGSPTPTDATSDPAVDPASSDPVVDPLAPTTVPPPITPPAAGPSYPTLPDGSPDPIVGIYSGDLVSITGNVPTQAAKDRLIFLGVANSQSENPVLNDQITINPDVPIGIGIRVIEGDSVRFPDGQALITPEHALQLDRALGILNAFPNVTVLIIGHSDQRGSEEQNFEISRDRAQAVNDYFVSKGVSPLRISSRAVGEADLLTDNDDAASLALNRRTEFVFYGLLIE